MNDIRLTADTIPAVCRNVLRGVEICRNRERDSKQCEYYLRCGGGYDTESTTITDDKGKPLFAFVYHIQIMINDQYIYFRDMELLVPFFRQLCEEVKKFKKHRSTAKQPVLIIWIANLAHEYAFFKRQLSEVGISDCFAKTERDPLKITLQDCIELRECIGLFGGSLAEIAANNTKTQKLKGDLDYGLIRTPSTPLTQKEYQYCRNDVAILNELSEVAFREFTDQKLKIPMTATGILRQKCKNRINNKYYEEKSNTKLMPEKEADYVMQRRYSYAGGLSGTSPVYAGQFVKLSKSADIVSDYPAQMNHHLFPAGELKETKPENFSRIGNKFKIVLFSADIIPKTKHAVLSVHKIMNYLTASKAVPEIGRIRAAIPINGKLWEGRNALLLLNNTEIKALSELYSFKHIRIYRLWYFTEKRRAPKFLRDCMNEDYLLKKQLKNEGKKDTAIYAKIKAAINSYYGMTATRLYDCIFKYCEAEKDIREAAAELDYERRREKMWLSPYIAYWTTSYARAIIMHYIAKYPDLILQYDTDSLYYITDPEEVPAERIAALEADLLEYNKMKIQQNRRLFKNYKAYEDLGTWEIDEENSTGFKGLGAKRYIVRTAAGKLKPTVAGMIKSSFIEYIEETKADPFAVFENDFTLNRIRSKKLASKYNDEHIGLKKVTDYIGNTEIIDVGTYHALFPIEFTIKGADTFVKLAQLIKEEKALPPSARTAEKMLQELRRKVRK